MPVYRRKDSGNWIIRFYWDDGTRFQQTYKKDEYTKREVEALERSIRASGKERGRQDHTIAELAERYWNEHAKRLSWSDAISAHLDIICNEFGDKALLGSITTGRIAEAVAKWRELPIFNTRIGKTVTDRKTGKPKLPSPSTINRRLAVLQGAFSMASDVWEWDTPRIAWKRLKLREAETIERNLGVGDQERLLDACPPWLRDIVEFALATGLRQGPILSLQWQEIDRSSRMIVPVGKGRKSNPVELSDWAMLILDRIPDTDIGPVFTRNGQMIKSLQGAWESARARAGLPSLRFHDLRHTFAQSVMDATGDAALVQDALHHASITTTRRYAHRRRSHIRDAVERAQRGRSEKV